MTDYLDVTDQDRQFAADILDDFGTFEEGIEDQEKLAQWVRNIRNAALRSVAQPQFLSDCKHKPMSRCRTFGRCLDADCKHAGMQIEVRALVKPFEPGDLKVPFED